MAVPGFSGSGGGISDFYRTVIKKDVQVGITKYKKLAEQVDKQYKPIFEKGVKELEKLLQSFE
ncbi:MAG: hypothetical protein IB618_02025 [Candidatus Pacearchaeota archaeon]|nr:MAG: hypothetical protein IB618_02025 [Candidatus Pacearchaeota archaeon]